MKTIITAILALSLFSCNNGKIETTSKDSLTKSNTSDTLHTIIADSAREEYVYITGIEKMHDSIFIKADYVQFFNGPTVLEEAKKRHRADTSFDKNGKVQDVFVPDDYFIVNDDKQLRTLYLPGSTSITMDSEIAGEKVKNINNYAYFSQHFKNSLFKLMVKNNMVTVVKEVFLP